jgi:hypothetical protein
MDYVANRNSIIPARVLAKNSRGRTVAKQRRRLSTLAWIQAQVPRGSFDGNN